MTHLATSGSGPVLHIKHTADGWSLSPIILAWLIAAILRVALGSATVPVVTASGVALPLLADSGVHVTHFAPYFE
ncbi:hypothetical protein GCM10010339_38380 [Streptomyces alanosinicus]|uniref:Uncharacterized protein n=1 Tax=Streptomyces alanosinicus TaxID=68171 RepID=A0A919D4J0_9ACTN|nr:hypothetical protein GCM10010339_38380 [Streptomyces alanosinicus]